MQNLLNSLPEWVRTNKLYKAKLKPGLGKASFDPDWDDERQVAAVSEANLVSSEVYKDNVGNAWHTPILDLDMRAAIIPSSTEGHCHLYIDTLLSEDRYSALLTALRDAGIIEEGIVQQYNKHGATTLRLPHIKKEPEEWEKENPEPVDPKEMW